MSCSAGYQTKVFFTGRPGSSRFESGFGIFTCVFPDGFGSRQYGSELFMEGI